MRAAGVQKGAAMNDAVDKAREARNLLERLAARLPGFAGYQERELRREVDARVRRELAERLDRARTRLGGFIRTLSLTEAALVGRLDGAAKDLDRVANTLRHAGSGYAGLFDAVKIREEQLAALYAYDLALLEDVEAVESGVADLAGGAGGSAELEQRIAVVATRVDGRAAAVKSVL